MADEARLLAVVEANTRQFENALKRLERTTDQSFRKQAQSAKQLDKTLTGLSAQAASFAKSFSGAFGLTVGAGGAAAAVSALVLLGNAAKEAALRYDDLADAAKNIGIGVDELQKLQIATRVLGGDVADVIPAMQRFSDELGEAQRGSGDLLKLFEANGVSLKNAQGEWRSLNEMLREFANLVQRAPTRAMQQDIVRAATGQKGFTSTLAAGANEIERIGDEAEKSGKIVDKELINRAGEFAERWQSAAEAAGGAWDTFLLGLAAGVEQMLQDVEALPAKIVNAVTPTDEDRVKAITMQIERMEQAYKRTMELAAKGDLVVSDAELTEQTMRIEALKNELKELQKAARAAGLAFPSGTGPVGPFAPGGGATVIPAGGGTTSSSGKTVNELAAALIAEVEGEVLEQARYDVNHWRMGFSSDTYTDIQGMKHEVKEGMTTTIADAWRDLNRRIAEAQVELMKQVGTEAYNKLTEGEKAALTSVMYHHGAQGMPPSVIAAAQAGVPGGVAASIEALPGFRTRHLREAQVAMGGDVKAYDALIAKEEEAAQKQAEYNEKIAEFEALLKAEGHAIELETEALFASTAQQEYLAEKQRLTNELTAAGIPLTEKYAAAIDELAQKRAANVVVQEQNDLALEREQDAMQLSIEKADQLRTAFSDVAGGLATDLLNGVKPAEALANALGKILDQLIQIGMQQLTAGLFGPMGSPLGGLLGGFLAPVLHSGGVVGQAGAMRQVNPMVFAGAPRFHNGGLPGLGSGEVAAILKKGEIVMPGLPTAAGLSARVRNNQRVGVDVNVGVEPSPLFVATVDTRARQAEDSAVRRSGGYITDRTRRQAGGRI